MVCKLPNTAAFIENVHQPLSEAMTRYRTARPFASITKLAVGVIQLVGGFVASVLLSPTICTKNQTFDEYFIASAANTVSGACEIYTALKCILSLGYCVGEHHHIDYKHSINVMRKGTTT